MSWYAVSWARAQQCGSPALKVTLMVLAEFANDQNLAWPSQRTLSTATEQSVDTVARSLRKLEEKGFIERAGEKKRPDGGKSVVVYRLLFDGERFERESQANRSPKSNTADCGIGNTADCGEQYRTEDGTKPANCGDKNLTNKPPKEPTPNPNGELGEGSSIEDQIEKMPSKTAAERFDRLREAWPSDPTVNWLNVEKRFFQLSASDQADAARIAPRYVAYCEQIGRKLKFPGNWIRDRGWEGFIEEERKAVAAAAKASVRVFVREGTPAWEAWRAYDVAHGRVPRTAHWSREHRANGWWFDTLFPPEDPAPS